MSESENLPNGWVASTLEDIGQIERGVTFPASAKGADEPGSIACLRTTNVQKQVEWDDLLFIPKSFVKGEAKYLREGDILISMANSRELVGKVALTTHLPRQSTFGGFIAAIRAFNPLEPKYLFYYLRSEKAQQYLRGTSSQTVNIANLSLGAVYSLTIPVAPIAEQRRIVAAIEEQFTRLDAGVAALRSARTRLKQYRAAVLKAAVEGKLTEAWRAAHPDTEPASALLARILAERRARWEEEQRAKGRAQSQSRYAEPQVAEQVQLSPLPLGWRWVRLEQLVSLVTSGSRGWAEFYAEEGLIFIRAQDINSDELRLDTVAHVRLPSSAEGTRTRVYQHDLLVTITGANVTKTALVREPLDEAYVSQHVGLVRPVSSDLAPYLYHWIVTPSYGRKALEKAAYGAGKPGLGLDNLRDLLVALPPLQEQIQIVAEIDRRLSVLSALESSIIAGLQRAERLRQSILTEAFAGRLVPQDPDDEPASGLLGRIGRERNAHAAPRTPRARGRGTASGTAPSSGGSNDQHDLVAPQQLGLPSIGVKG